VFNSEDFDPEQLSDAILRGERTALAACLNLLDDQRGDRQSMASSLLTSLRNAQDARDTPPTPLIGITGPPGVGKSSLTAALISVWRRRGLRVGVIAVDPSSPISGGALLGDRLRMKANDDDGVFVRSLSSRGEFGGLSEQVWPMSLLMLAAFDIVLIETVGVGQREIDIASSCDTTCFVAQPGSGDSVQFLKAGVLEVPHIIVVNKEDMGAVASRTLAELSGAVNRDHPDGNWEIPLLSTSATLGKGIEALADLFDQHHQHLLNENLLQARRQGFQANWILKRLDEEFGRAGLNRLGGTDALQAELAQQIGNPLIQYSSYHDKLKRGE